MLEAFGLSDPGCVRTNNEDYFISDAESGIFILADGMGGAQGGEYASRISAERLYEFLLSSPSSNGADALERGFIEANLAVREAAKSNAQLEGMGTTLVAARLIGPDQLRLGSVGDSRAYLCSKNELSLITRDQTWVAEVGSRLGLSEEALKSHPMRHVLTMAIGCAEDVRVHSHLVSVAPGDQILLCSDGLHGVIEEKTVQSILLSEKTLSEKCHYLIEAANDQGGPDNITVVLIRFA
ncbi:MAG: serine/threonine-protein phosphatase [Acidobacteriaceae bacterium]|nr:serine/threonine-protein phosphatase [Acidobacteriaceae bacterium]